MYYALLALIVISAFIAAYVLLIRPFLRTLPQLKEFFQEADTFWGKVWACVHRDAGVAWSYIVLVIGGIFDQLDNIASILGDPDFKSQVADFFSADPKTLGLFMVGAALVVFAARMRAINKR